MQRLPTLVSVQKEMPLPVPIDFASPFEKRRLMVSDNPETLDEASMPVPHATLWHDVVQRADGEPTLHRVFGWHLNRTGSPLTIGLTIENGCSDSSRLTVSHLRRIAVFSSGDYLAAGMRLAGNFMAGSWEHYWPFRSVGARESAVLDALTVQEGELVGFIYEFSVNRHGRGELRYILRTVASTNGAGELANINALPLERDGTHPRGSWPFADVFAATDVYRTGETMSQSVSNGRSDRVFTASVSVDPVHALHNVGQYGARIHILVPVYNDSTRERLVRLMLNPRGGVYAGAVAGCFGVKTIPVLRPQGVNAALLGYWRVKPGLSQIRFDVMHAGAASLPLAVYVDTVDEQM